MPNWLVDALYYALVVLGVLIILDGLVLLFMWRVSVYRRNIARRENRPDPTRTSHNDDWFSEAAQKELYSDFSV